MEYRYHYEVSMDPVAKGRHRFTSRGHAYTPAKTKNAQRFIHETLKNQVDHEPLEGPLAMRTIFYLERPKSVKRLYPTVKPDLSNYLKLIEDAMNGVVYKDDSQIIFSQEWKLYADNCTPRVIVSIAEVSCTNLET